MNDNLKTSQILDCAADEIEARGWHVGSGGWGWGGQQSPLCLEGAIGAAQGISDGLSRAFNTCPAGRAVRDYLDMGEYNHDFVSREDPGAALYVWNDTPLRTQQEVIEVLRAAAAVERVKEATASYETADQPLPVEIPETSAA